MKEGEKGLRHPAASSSIMSPHFPVLSEEHQNSSTPKAATEAEQTAFDLAQERRLQSLRLLVVGDVMYDVFEHYTSTKRKELKSEFPGKWAFVNAREVEALGGAANVAANLARVGVKTSLVGVVGDDDEGRAIARLCDSHEIRRQLITASDRNTTWKARLYIDGEFLLRRDRERDEPIDAAAIEIIVEAVAAELPGTDALILSDYNKGIFSAGTGLAQRIIERAAKTGVPIVVDCKPVNTDEFRGATVIAPNNIEAEQLVPGFADDRIEGIHKLRDRLGVRYCVVTLGEDGLLCASDEGVIHIPGERVKVKNPVGAGDTVRAFLGVAIAMGKPIEECLRIANAAAARVIQKDSTATLGLDEVLDVLRAQQRVSPRRLGSRLFMEANSSGAG